MKIKSKKEKEPVDLIGAVIFTTIPIFFIAVLIAAATAIGGHNTDYAARNQSNIVKVLKTNYSETGTYPENSVKLKNFLNEKNVDLTEKTTLDYSSNGTSEYDLLVVNDHYGSTRATTHKKTTN